MQFQSGRIHGLWSMTKLRLLQSRFLFWNCLNHCWWCPCIWWTLSRCWCCCLQWRISWWTCCRLRWSWRRCQCSAWGRPTSRESAFFLRSPCMTVMLLFSKISSQWLHSVTNHQLFWSNSFQLPVIVVFLDNAIDNFNYLTNIIAPLKDLKKILILQPVELSVVTCSVLLYCIAPCTIQCLSVCVFQSECTSTGLQVMFMVVQQSVPHQLWKR